MCVHGLPSAENEELNCEEGSNVTQEGWDSCEGPTVAYVGDIAETADGVQTPSCKKFHGTGPRMVKGHGLKGQWGYP